MLFCLGESLLILKMARVRNFGVSRNAKNGVLLTHEF